MAIRGVHTMFYTAEPEALRAFLRDKLGFPCSDVGDGWLIFDLPEADMGCHPADPTGKHGAPDGTHDISFYCDDIKKSVAALKKRGVKFTQKIANRGYGLVTCFLAPGGLKLQLYQPLYEKRKAPARRKKKAARKPVGQRGQTPLSRSGFAMTTLRYVLRGNRVSPMVA